MAGVAAAGEQPRRQTAPDPGPLAGAAAHPPPPRYARSPALTRTSVRVRASSAAAFNNRHFVGWARTEQGWAFETNFTGVSAAWGNAGPSEIVSRGPGGCFEHQTLSRGQRTPAC